MCGTCETSGYREAIQSRPAQERTIAGPAGRGVRLPASREPLPSPARPLHLASVPRPTPVGRVEGLGQPLEFGGRPDGKTDSTAAIQQAIDAGRSTSTCPTATGSFRATSSSRGRIRRITGCEARIGGTGTASRRRGRVAPGDHRATGLHLRGRGHRAVQRADAGDPRQSPSAIGRLREQGLGRPVPGRRLRRPFVFHKQNVWARQLNVENDGTHILNDGGTLWILGYKTERAGR